MHKMKFTLLLAAAMLVLCLAGCTGEGEAEALRAQNAQLSEKLSLLEAENAELREQLADEEETPSVYIVDGSIVLPESEAAQEPALCSDFFGLAWGGSYDALFAEPNNSVVEQKGVEYGGFMGSAFYSFGPDGLSNGQVAFYTLPDKNDLDIFAELHSYLTGLYGLPKSENLGEDSANAVWKVNTAEGQSVQITLVYGASPQSSLAGETALWFSLSR